MVSDSLELAAMRRAGVGHEHVPGHDDPQAVLAGTPYPEFVRRRLELILAERRRPRRLVAVGAQAASVLASFGTLSR